MPRGRRVRMKRIAAMLLCLSLSAVLLGGCGFSAGTAEEAAPTAEPPPAEMPMIPSLPAATAEQSQIIRADTMNVGVGSLSGVFSPFSSGTEADAELCALTQLPLLSCERGGGVILRGIEGEMVEYNSVPYTYYGPADLEITLAPEGTAYYDISLRKDIRFSDGEPLDIDDVIFTMYVLCDPSYEGGSAFSALPIEGLPEYRDGMDTLFHLLTAAGRGNLDFSLWTRETQDAFWTELDGAGEAFAQEITDYCISAYGAANVFESAALWGYELPMDADAGTFFRAMAEAYGGDYEAMSAKENAGTALFAFMEHDSDYQTYIETGGGASNISGIQRLDDYRMRLALTRFAPEAVYAMTFPIAPLHYYGDAALYDYDAGSFGFPRGDLGSVRARVAAPLGAGPYCFTEFADGVARCRANEDYYRGAPQIKNLNLVQCDSDGEKLRGLLDGSIDIAAPAFSETVISVLERSNGGAVSGNVISARIYSTSAYGCVGINANRVNVGGEPGSEASKNLRRAFATLFAVCRDTAVRDSFGESAAVTNVPPPGPLRGLQQSAEAGEGIPFSTGADGRNIYAPDMDAQARRAAAAEAALDYFVAAGYTVSEGKLAAAPSGASLEYSFCIPAGSAGAVAAGRLAGEVRTMLSEMGMTLRIVDGADSSELRDALRAQRIDFWASDWADGGEEDLYSLYFSGDETREAGAYNDYFAVDDPELNRLILEARATADQEQRRALYRDCLDIIFDWAVAIPVYRLRGAALFSTGRVDTSTVPDNLSFCYGWEREIEQILMN